MTITVIFGISGGLLILVIFLGFNRIHNSYRQALVSTVNIFLIVISYLIAFIANIVQILGSIFPITSIYSNTFDKYIGKEFVRERRADFIERGISYLDESGFSSDESKDEIINNIQETSQDSEKKLSNGEFLIGFLLALVGFFSIHLNLLGPVLAVGLGVAVGLRTTALSRIIFQDPDPDLPINRLIAMRSWNTAMSNRVKIIPNLLVFKFLVEIDERLYQIYLDNVLEKAFKKDIGRMDVGKSLFRPFLSVILEKMA